MGTGIRLYPPAFVGVAGSLVDGIGGGGFYSMLLTPGIIYRIWYVVFELHASGQGQMN